MHPHLNKILQISESLPNEEWRDIAGYEGSYQVSNKGRVRSLYRTIRKKNGDTLTVEGRILRPGIRPDKHLIVVLRKSNKPRTRSVHRLVIETFIGPRPEGMECCHYDGNPANNCVENLRWDTRTANQRDLIRHGTKKPAKGAANGRTKLTVDQVIEIRRLFDSGELRNTNKLAIRFNVNSGAIWHIVHRVNWKHLL